MFKKNIGSFKSKISEVKKDIGENSSEAAGEYLNAHLPAIRSACDQVVAKACGEGSTLDDGAQLLTSKIINDEKQFEKVLSHAYATIPLPKFIPRWLFIRFCKKNSQKLLAVIPVKDS